MKIIYTCPKCGNDLVDVCLCSNPAKNTMYCLNCGFMTEPEIEEIIRIPYGGNYHYDHVINDSCGEADIGLSLLAFRDDAMTDTQKEMGIISSLELRQEIDKL